MKENKWNKIKWNEIWYEIKLYEMKLNECDVVSDKYESTNVLCLYQTFFKHIISISVSIFQLKEIESDFAKHWLPKGNMN